MSRCSAASINRGTAIPISKILAVKVVAGPSQTSPNVQRKPFARGSRETLATTSVGGGSSEAKSRGQFHKSQEVEDAFKDHENHWETVE
jgi:hypothetical protein